ncbi:MAG: hypothetical protein II924_01745, partial [Kiritimatiellae bacterium]|nr:hypothetical protein [Kiritimatiellia bacterium]
MTLFSPLTKKRFRSFKRIRRAWWSLIALGVIFVFCMLADVVCPCDPRAVVDTATLEKYRKPVVEETYDVKTARFSVSGQEVFDFEGPDDVRAKVLKLLDDSLRLGENPMVRLREAFGDEYEISLTKRQGYDRLFLEPKAPPAVTLRELPAP